MKTSEQQLNNVSNIETLKDELTLTVAEKAEFKKLPRAEQKKQNEEKLEKLTELQDKLNEVMKEATETGDQEKLEEAKKIKLQVENGVKDLEEKVGITEIFSVSMEIIPDPEITSAETAIAKLEAGYEYGIFGDAKDLLVEVDWDEKLKESYEIVPVSVGELFSDTEKHTYTDIKTKAEENGLVLIPARLAPSILLHSGKRIYNTTLAMNPIGDNSSGLKLFNYNVMGQDALTWLGSADAASDIKKWHGDAKLFFTRE